MAERIASIANSKRRRPLPRPEKRNDGGPPRNDRDREVTRKLDEVLAHESSELHPAWRRAQARSVGSAKW